MTLRAGLVLSALIIGAALGAAQSVTDAWQQQHHTLARNGAWSLSKLALSPPPAGARAMRDTPVALRDNKLNLGAWSGYQELLRRSPMDLSRLDSGFKLGPDHCLHVVWGVTEQGSAGLRLSTYDPLPTMAWTADADGVFTSRTPLQAGLEPGWGIVRVEVDKDGAFTATVNDTSVVRGRGPRGVGRVGFRGCLDWGWVDDVRIRGRSGRTVAEDWEPRGREAVFAAALVLLLLGGAGLGLTARWIAGPTSVIPWLAALLLLVAAGVGASLHSSADKRTWGIDRDAAPDESETIEPHELTDRIAAQVRSNPEGPRILFVGSGQTAGHGTKHPEDGFVERTCALLPSTPDGPWACLNGGLNGGHSDELFKLTRDQWMQHHPALLVLTAGDDETDLLRFERSLVRFAELAAANGAQLVLATAPSSSEEGPTYREEQHAAVLRTADGQGVPLVDLRSALSRRRDDGLLWWDRDTLSAAGHQVVAEELAGVLTSLLAAPLDQPSAQNP